MARNEPRVEAGTGGVDAEQAKPTEDLSAKQVKARLVNEADRDLHPSGDPEHEADQSSYPPKSAPPQERPPISTTKPDVPIITSLVTGAGAHEPPPPGEFDADGRPYHDGNPKP